MVKRESSASLIAAPKPYEQSEPAKPQKILEFDCRGLEFVEFKPEVGCHSKDLKRYFANMATYSKGKLGG